MKYELFKLEKLSGDGAGIYTVYWADDELHLFDQFLAEHIGTHATEVKNILTDLKAMGTHGVSARYLRTAEGPDGVCALPMRNEVLRLYGIWINQNLLVVGSGAEKKVQRWQDDPELSKQVRRMIDIARDIRRKLDTGEWQTENGDFYEVI